MPPATAAPAHDVAVVGAGIVGLAVARELLRRRPGLRLAVVEREDAVGAHQTGHSSGVVHAGIPYAPGSLKARLCVAGARELESFCAEHGVAFERCGKVVVAVEPAELGRLDELERRGRANGVPGLRRVDAAELRELEPHAAGIAALHSPATAITDFPAVARALAADVRARGGSVALGRPVTGVRREPGRLTLVHPGATTTARAAVFCAGLWADRLAVAAGADPDPRIVPFRGAYLRVRPERRGLVRALVYPVPDPALPFLGVHLHRGVDGEVHIGPTALLVGARDAYALGRVRPGDAWATATWPGSWRMGRRWWRTAATEIASAASRRALVARARRYVPALTSADVLDGPSGVRAQAVARDGTLVDDFVLARTDRALHVRNAPSPAATSCLALARLVADRVDAELLPG